MSDEIDPAIEDYLQMFDPVLRHHLQILIKNSFIIAQELKEHDKSGIKSQSNEQAILPAIIGHEKSINS
jgi:hypothetical protein